MNHMILIITIFIIALFALRGYRKGFLGLIYGVFTWVFMIIFVWVGAPMIEDYLTGTSVYTSIYTTVDKLIRDKVDEKVPGLDLTGRAGAFQDEYALETEPNGVISTGVSMEDIQGLIDSGAVSLEQIQSYIDSGEISVESIEGLMESGEISGEEVEEILREQGVDPAEIEQAIGTEEGAGAGEIIEQITNGIVNSLENSGIDIGGAVSGEISGVMDSVTTSITDRIVHIVAIVLAVILSLVICQFVRIIIEWVHDLPILGRTGDLLGLAWGVMEGFIVVWILYTFIALLGGTAEGLSAFSEINENPFLLWLFQHNPIAAVFL